MNRWERGITGAAQVVGTAGSITAGVTSVARPRAGGPKPPGPKPGAKPLSCSFAPDTPVLTPGGLVPIAEIKDGDLVAARDDITGDVGFKPVLLAYSSIHRSSIVLDVLNAGGRDRVTTTPEHPLWVRGQGWTTAGEVKHDDYIRVLDGWALVVASKEVPGNVRTYNLDVAEWDTFFVGEEHTWVHNCDITKPYKRPSGATTKEMRKSVQGKPCVDCGKVTAKQVADHKKPLVEEYYETGTIDKVKMRSKEAVQPQCPTCSAQQGGKMSKYSKEKKKEHGFDKKE